MNLKELIEDIKLDKKDLNNENDYVKTRATFKLKGMRIISKTIEQWMIPLADNYTDWQEIKRLLSLNSGKETEVKK